MKCSKCKFEMDKEALLEYIIHKCPKCGERKITDYMDKEVDSKTRMSIEEIYNGG